MPSRFLHLLCTPLLHSLPFVTIHYWSDGWYCWMQIHAILVHFLFFKLCLLCTYSLLFLLVFSLFSYSSLYTTFTPFPLPSFSPLSQHSLIHLSHLPAHRLPPSCCSLLHVPPPRSHPHTLSLALSPTPSLPMSSFPLHILSDYLHFRPTIYHHRYFFSVLFLSCPSLHAGR